MNYSINTNIKEINHVGPTTANQFKRLGIETIQDLIFHWPWRFEDFRHPTPINSLKPDLITNVVGQIEIIQNKRSPKKHLPITEAFIKDETGQLKVIWFNQPFITRNLHVGDYVSLAGKIKPDYLSIAMHSPEYEKISNFNSSDNSQSTYNTQGILPVYHSTAKLTQKQIRFIINQIINKADEIIDWLPEKIKKNQKLINLNEAIKKIHQPKTKEDLVVAKKRLGFNELFLIQLKSQLIRKNNESFFSTPINFKEKETREFVKNLPFQLTNDQKKVTWQILQDLEKDKPMSRLLEGDVGSGKTIVAITAMLNVFLNNQQSVLMAPTEILAHQHYLSFCKFLSNFDIKIGLVTSSQKLFSKDIFKKEDKKITTDFVIENADIVIGTHTLIQKNIKFKKLALVIIDEQHRFGVEQRKILTKKEDKKSLIPHLLSMTATPIPRSLAMVIYGDLDISVIKEIPPGRQKIVTQIISETQRNQAYTFIREKIKTGQQAFVICPLIDFVDTMEVKAVKEEVKKIKKIFPEFKIEVLHGKIKSAEKEIIMKKFQANEINILVATSVIEVGVDLPNASIILIEGADRFGLAQLHQFRGRVGRGIHQSYCFLFAESKSPKTIRRLNALVKHSDGFMLAKIDLQSRGPGQFYGTMQKGWPDLKIASLFDFQLMKTAKEEVQKLIQDDKKLKNYPELLNRVTHGLF